MADTWLDPEERAYPGDTFTRRGRARLRQNEHNPMVLPYGTVRAVKAKVADTYWTIPARLVHKGKTIKGFLSTHDGEICFTPEADPARCTGCAPGTGCRR